MALGYLIARHRQRSVAQRRAKTDYLSGMPPKRKDLEWGDNAEQAMVFDKEDAVEIVRLFQRRLAGFLFSVKVVRREVKHSLILLDPKTKKPVYGEKGWKDYRTDRVTPPGCNEKTGQLF